MSSEKNYDELFYPILCSEGNSSDVIVTFFDRVFDFLYRRTDFFTIKKDKPSKLGLSGEAETVVKNAFIKYMNKAVAEAEKSEIGKALEEPDVQDYISEEIVETTVLPEPKKSTVESVQRAQEKDEHKGSGTKSKNEKGAKKRENKIHLMDSESYNGATYDGYSWAQTLKEIDVHIKVPNDVTLGTQVRAKIQQSHLCIEILSKGTWVKLKDSDLSWKINVEESTWILVPQENIFINLRKLQDRWWDSLFQEEPKIDTQVIDASMPYEDLDEGSRAKIQELMFNEHQKRLGKPTIEQLKIQDALKDAWDCEGSPFRGQPYDPSIINIQDSGNTS